MSWCVESSQIEDTTKTIFEPTIQGIKNPSLPEVIALPFGPPIPFSFQGTFEGMGRIGRPYPGCQVPVNLQANRPITGRILVEARATFPRVVRAWDLDKLPPLHGSAGTPLRVRKLSVLLHLLGGRGSYHKLPDLPIKMR